MTVSWWNSIRPIRDMAFSSNKGYGSKVHLDALAALGVTPWHRRTYEPIKGLASRLALPPAISEDKLLKLK